MWQYDSAGGQGGIAVRAPAAVKSSRPYARVERVLGAKSSSIKNAIELHERIAEGLPRSAVIHLVENLSRSVFDLAELFRALNISERTWHRTKSEKEPTATLDTDLSARVWNLAY